MSPTEVVEPEGHECGDASIYFERDTREARRLFNSGTLLRTR